MHANQDATVVRVAFRTEEVGGRIVRLRASDAALEARARRGARKAGLLARKSRWRAGSLDNLGGFMLVDPSRNFAVAGSRYELSAEAVLDYCRDEI